MSPFTPFEMERWQSTWEHRVRFNLSESGVHPMSTRELLELGGPEGEALAAELPELRQGYGQSNGSDGLRARIAALYPGADESSVVATVGGAEANFATLWRLLDNTSRWAAILPTYMQIPGLVRCFGGELLPIPLLEEEGWQPDPDAVGRAFEAGARVLLVTNPNNPTGARLEPDRMEAVAAHAARHGAWIVADEVYAGAEVTGEPTPSFHGRHDRVVVTQSLSKAYGLPGLRVGWAVANAELARELWGRTDYTTITPATLSDALATLALSPEVRPRILERTRQIIRANRDRLAAWAERQEGRFAYRPPEAGAIAFLRYGGGSGSSEIAERLRVEESVLVVPGDHFGMDGFLRIGFGLPAEELDEALARVESLFDRVEREAAAGHAG
jgi:aspartate/methionine/tyrosine aminotransferase